MNDFAHLHAGALLLAGADPALPGNDPAPLLAHLGGAPLIGRDARQRRCRARRSQSQDWVAATWWCRQTSLTDFLGCRPYSRILRFSSALNPAPLAAPCRALH